MNILYVTEVGIVQNKLTLRLEDALIRRMKRYSATTGKSVSRLVADYFSLIDAGTDANAPEPTPRVRSLRGALAGTGVTEKDHRRYLEKKHR
jgi:hypothetical protein